MKIIFLATNGVLNNCCNSVLSNVLLDEKIELLKEIVDYTNVKIVLTSSWQKGEYLKILPDGGYDALVMEMVHELFEKFGLALLDRTEELGHRGKEISKWLEGCTEDTIESYVVLDCMDKEALRPHDHRLIKMHPHEALTERHVEEAIRLLNEK